MSLEVTTRLFWAAGFLGHLVLLAVLFTKGRSRQFPFFTALIGLNVFKTSTLFLVGRFGSDATYLRTYMAVWLLDVLLQIAVAYEVAAHVFRPLGRWAPDVRTGLLVLGLGSLAIATGLTWMAAPGASKWEFAALIKANFFSSVLFGELLLGMVILSVTVGLPWRTHVARIAYGLGAYAVVCVLIEAGHALYSGLQGATLGAVLTLSRNGTYLMVLGFWIATLWQDAPAGRELPKEMREELSKLQSRLAYDLYTIRNWRKP